MARAEAAKIEAEATVIGAKLKAEAMKIETDAELERMKQARDAELHYTEEQNRMEIDKNKVDIARRIDIIDLIISENISLSNKSLSYRAYYQLTKFYNIINL